MVSPLLLILATSIGGQFSATENAAIAKVRGSLVTLAEGGRPLGAAVLVSDDGRFVAHKSATRLIGRDGVIGTLSDGRKIRLFLEVRDIPTQFVMLQARPWEGGIKPAKVIEGALAAGTPLISLNGQNVFRAEVSRREKIGVDDETRRMVPLTELRFEGAATGAANVGGAALFTLAGDYAGCVTATLNSGQTRATADVANALQRSVGPMSLIVGYATAPDVTRRVVEGFRSASRRPQVAAVGVLCRDAPGGGALIEGVDPKSPAYSSGLMINDVILEIGGRLIGDQIGFAKALYALRPGETVVFRIRRGQNELKLSVPLTISDSSIVAR